MNREMLKNAVLVSLFALCLALTGSILFDISDDDSKTFLIDASKLNVVENATSVMSPQSYLVSFGGGLHTGVFSNEIRDIMWTEVTENLKIYFQTGIYTPISAREWTEAVNSRSFRVILPMHYYLDNMYNMLGVPVKTDEIVDIQIDSNQ